MPDELPDDIDLANPPEQLPELPKGYVWALKITATAEVIHPDGSRD
jgi:hypothetical protein